MNIIRLLWRGKDLFMHMLIIGPPRSGKTSTILKPMIYQLLKLKARGVPLGLSVIEPKGDLAYFTARAARLAGLPVVHIDPVPPARRGYAAEDDRHYPSAGFNPLSGDEDLVAEATVTVLQSLGNMGAQDPYFRQVQELAARMTVKLLKRLYGERVDLMRVVETLRATDLMRAEVARLKAKGTGPEIVQFFESEMLSELAQQYRQHATGLRVQLENLVANANLRKIIAGESTINIDAHYAYGGILAANTALGELGPSGDALGQYLIMHLQAGAYRRPGTEKTRIPHFLIIDEVARYINPDFERFLSLAPEYRVTGILATQSLGQLEVQAGKYSPRAMKQIILTNTRNKIIFGGISAQDAKELADELGKNQIIVRQATYRTRVLIPALLPHDYRDTESEEYRFPYTQLMDGLPAFHYVARLARDGVPQKPVVGRGGFVPADWEEEFRTLRKSVPERLMLPAPAREPGPKEVVWTPETPAQGALPLEDAQVNVLFEKPKRRRSRKKKQEGD
ncbi:MAG: conjugation protein, TraG/TraD family, (pXO1-42) [Hydrogenibacillus schlegelii]|uniref:Conjugation protein, TraG/TraD family, (PXO1-42) n=1 Tax=Hydrogenibacillus schlegelii TaxID=1484 RepID=A0A2T5G4D4_HYDSH|nr:MAG: conjugation protein, TraG/TraD family, (pXO1-42) [Hydrogenibacillus schlegelii]